MAVLKARASTSDSFVPVSTMGQANATQSQRGLMSAQDKLNLDTLVNLLVPVGVVLTFAGDVDPNDIYAGTTWELLKDTFLLGKGDTYTTLGATGGSADAVVVSHTHDAGTLKFASINSAAGGNNEANAVRANTTGYYTGLISGNTGSTGESGTGKNMPPYTVVNFWKRTA